MKTDLKTLREKLQDLFNRIRPESEVAGWVYGEIQAMLKAPVETAQPVGEEFLKLLMDAHRQLDREYQANTRHSQSVSAANATGGETPKGYGISGLAESAYMHSIGNDTKAMLDRLYAAIRDFHPTPQVAADTNKGAAV